MFQKKKYENDLSYLASEIVKKKAVIWASDPDGSLYGFLASNLLVGTITLNTHAINLPATLRKGTKLCLDVMRLQYVNLCRNLLGSHYNRNREIKRQPVTVAFVDLEPETRRVGRYSSGSNPHIHFVMLFHPTTDPETVLAQGTRTGERYRMAAKDRRISTFDLERFNQDKGSLEKLSAYISKTASHPAFSDKGADLFALYPDRYAGESAHLAYAFRSAKAPSTTIRSLTSSAGR